MKTLEYAGQADRTEPKSKASSGLHEALSEAIRRLRQLNDACAKLVMRARGPFPEPAETETKTPETPSVGRLADTIHREIADLEACFNQLAEFIG